MQQLPAWQPAPERLILEPGWVHVFRLRLDLPVGALAGLLSADERERAARYRFERDQIHFTCARGQLRQVLANYLQIDPREVQFCTNPHGKPALTGHSALHLPQLEFNLSHSGERGLLAVCETMAVGIDIELKRENLERDNIAQRFFAPAEVAALNALPAEQQFEAFFACWTRKEAYMKARGRGLSIPLESFEVSLAPDQPARLLKRDPEAPNRPYTLLALNPGPGYAAAVAVEGQAAGLRLWDHLSFAG